MAIGLSIKIQIVVILHVMFPIHEESLMLHCEVHVGVEIRILQNFSHDTVQVYKELEQKVSGVWLYVLNLC